ncbi:hypothetical protein D9M69_719140 [compost metagenome]
MNDQIDIAPVDPEIKRRSRDHSPQCVGGHGLLDLAPLAGIERTMMQRDGQRVLIDPPEFPKQHLRLTARIDE